MPKRLQEVELLYRDGTPWLLLSPRFINRNRHRTTMSKVDVYEDPNTKADHNSGKQVEAYPYGQDALLIDAESQTGFRAIFRSGRM
jgi:hypothetical protein